MTSASQKFQDHGGLHPPRGKLHVTVLASEWRSTKGGLSTISRELAIQLAKFPEVKITYFVPQCTCSDEDKRTALSHHIEIVEATGLSGYDELEWLSFPPDDLHIDVIVGHGVKLGHQAQVIRNSHKCKWIQVVHTDPEELAMYKSYQKPISMGEKKHKVEVELCEKADFVVGVGPKLCEAFRRYLRWCKKDETILDLTPGVFDEFRNVKHASKERERCCILVFGRGDAEDFQLKGFDVACKAVAELSDAHLVFVGAPEGKHEDIAKRLLECGLPAHRLKVRSFLQSREDLKRLFCEVDLVLMPSRTEGFGLTGLEALSAGLPVLVSKNSGFGEALHKVPFGSACVIDSGDPLVWAEAIKEVWKKDRETRLQEAELLRSSYGERYSWAKQSEDLVKKMVNIVNQDCQSSSQGEEGLSASSTTKAPQTMTGEQTDILVEINKKLDDLSKEKEASRVQQSWELKSELPDEPANIHGHVTEVNDIVQALSYNSNKAVSTVLVSGISGIGKTTVAIQACHQLTSKHGSIVKFCSLRFIQSCEESSNHEESKGERELREILNVCVPGHHQTNENPRHVLLNWCRRLERELILVLDNAEDAMEEKVRDSFFELLKDMRKCSQSKLKFLITSRRSDIDRTTGLNIKAIKLGPLDLEESIEVLKNDATLESKSEDLRDNLQQIADLCEHIPLALQLAGPLLSSESEYTVEELVQKLQNNPTKTLECERMMEIAFEKLDESLQSALVCLSVFVRSFDRNAAKALLGLHFAEYLTKLKERCLIQKQDDRYLIHLLIRSYARQIGRKKFPHIVAHVQQTFLEYFLSLILSNAKTYWGKDKCKDSFDLFNAERLNYESTLRDVSNRKIRNCRQLEDVVDDCRLVAPYIGVCVPINLYEDFLKGLLHFAESQDKVINRVEILCHLYHEGRKRGSGRKEWQEEAIKLHDENSDLFEQHSLSEVFYAGHYARYLFQDCNCIEEAHPVLKKALSVYEEKKRECFEKGNPESIYDVAKILGQMGHIAKTQERTEEACENYLEALKLLKDDYGNHILTAFAHKDVADSYLYINQYSKAEENYQRAMRILEDMQKADHREAIPVLKNWGICFEKSCKFSESREKYEKGSDIAENTIEGNHKWKVWIQTYLALLLYTNYPEDVSTANKIAAEVLQMGKELKLNHWPMKRELEEMYITH